VGEDWDPGVRRCAFHLHDRRGLNPSWSLTKEKLEPDDRFNALVVATILDSNPEGALDLLCEQYGVERPKLGVGVVKGRGKGVLAVYSANRKEILAASMESLYDPFTILHEFYHHLRYFGMQHRGTEKYADRFALDYVRAYRSVIEALTRKGS
jgi:hypothetical protein